MNKSKARAPWPSGWDAATRMPYVHGLFMRIAEPRVIRLMHFLVYLCMLITGIAICFSPPHHLQTVVGLALLYVFAGFVTIGSALCAFAVLPGIWWLERVGIIMLTTSMAMYVVIILTLGTSVVAVAVALALTITFAQRWTEIRGAQLAPREV